MSGKGNGLSYLAVVLVTICLISFASFMFLSSPQKILGGMKDYRFRGTTTSPKPHSLEELREHVKRLEEAVKSHSTLRKGIENKSSEDNAADPLSALQPPTFDPNGSHQQPANANSLNSASTDVNKALDDETTTKWLSALASKLLCIRLRSGGIYLYHTRKAAGTSIRDILTTIAATWRVPYYETEGVVLNRDIIEKKNGLLTVTSLRDPVARILSLYWYEHVGWYDGVLKQTERCKSLHEWVNAWRDGSRWKSDFIVQNPDSVYVEIENYYVKMLSGWHARNPRTSRVTAEDLEAAKAVLRSFDVVLLSDWMGDSTQIEAMNALFPGRTSIAAGHKVKGDHKAKERLLPTLAPDEAEIRELLKEINHYDLELYAYAQSLMAYRLKFLAPAVEGVKAQLGLDSHLNTVVSGAVYNKHKDQCAALDSTLSPEFKKKYVGIFQPPGHKGPF